MGPAELFGLACAAGKVPGQRAGFQVDRDWREPQLQPGGECVLASPLQPLRVIAGHPHRDVARPTVFAHFPRKEDLFFDRCPEVAGQLTRAIRERPAGESAVSALRDTLEAAARAGRAPYGMQSDMIPWWRTVAASRALQARARELADQLASELAGAMAATGTAEPELAAALAVAAYRTIHLQAIRCILAGEDAATVAARHPDRIRAALSAVDKMTA
jgi:AcrR family transcriptional regulator